MKRKIAVFLASACAVSMLVACGSDVIESEYITVTQYKGVEIEEVPLTEVTDEMIEQAIQEIRERNAITNPVTDRPVREGDIAVIDFQGLRDGVAFEGGTGENHPLTIGSGQFIPGFEEGVIGHSIGDTFEIPITFPEEYHAPDLAGVSVVFVVTVNEIEEEILPELTDEFAQSMSEESQTVEEFREEVREVLEESNESIILGLIQSSAWRVVMDNTTVHKYPEGEVERITQAFIEGYQQSAVASGMEYEEFLEQALGMTVEEFEWQAEEEARRRVVEGLLIELIADKENLHMSDSEYEEAVEKYAERHGFESGEALVAAYGGEEIVRGLLLNERVKEWVAEHSVQVERVDEEE